jgi:retron-type reverse transcriptase
MIEGDIKSFFDMIDHHILAGLLTKHFSLLPPLSLLLSKKEEEQVGVRGQEASV